MLKFKSLIGIFLFALVFSLRLTAQKVDCGSPSSTAERANCVNRELQSAESDMNAVFEKALETYTPNSQVQKGWTGPAIPKSEQDHQVKWEARMRRDLEASQEAWLKYRATACATVREMYDGGTAAEVDVPGCKADLTESRTIFLRKYFIDQK
jgi:uncharacterized protein YecT (DUF1311 family)